MMTFSMKFGCLFLWLSLFVHFTSPFYVYNASLSGSYDSQKVIKIGLCLPYSGWPSFVKGGGVDTLRIWIDYMASQNFSSYSKLDDAILNIVLFDSGSSAAETYRAVLKSQPENFIAIIGCGFSGITQPAALVWSSFGTPQCDGGISSPIFSDKINYPYVFRTIPSDTFLGVGFANLVKYYGWKRVAIIYSDESYGQGLLDAFKSVSKSMDIEVAAQKSFYKWANASFTGILSDIKALDLRVILYFANYKDLLNLMQTAIDMNMKTPDYAWVSGSLSNVFAANDKNQIALTEGLIGLDPTFTTRPQSYLDFLPYWRSRISKFVNLTNTNDLPAYSPLFASCIQLLMSGYNRALSNPNITLANITAGTIKWKTPNDFYEHGQDTISGPMYLDKNGDRSALYDVVNVFNGTRRVIGNVVASTVTITSDAIFIGGNTNPPSDRLNKANYTYGLKLNYAIVGIVIFLAVIGFIACLVAGYILLAYRQQLKSYSPVFSLLIIFGLFLAFLLSFLSSVVGLDNKVVLSCIADTWISYLSFVFVFGSLLVKNVRVYRIFNNPKKNMKWLSDVDLYVQLGIMLLCSIGLLSIWTFVVGGADGITGNLVTVSSLHYEYQCQMPSSSSFIAINALILLYHGSIILAGLYVALNTRKVPYKFRESIFIGVCTYNIVIVLVFLLPLISFLNFDLLTQFTVKSLSILYLAFSTLLIFMVPKWKETLFFSSGKTSASDSRQKASNKSNVTPSFDTASAFEHPVPDHLKQRASLSDPIFSNGATAVKRQTFTVFLYKPYGYGLFQSITEAELSIFSHDRGCIVVVGEYGSVSEKLSSTKDPSAFKDGSVFVLPQCLAEPVSGSNKIVLSTDEREVDYPPYEIVFSPKNAADAQIIQSKLNLGLSSRKVNVESIRQ